MGRFRTKADRPNLTPAVLALLAPLLLVLVAACSGVETTPTPTTAAAAPTATAATAAKAPAPATKAPAPAAKAPAPAAKAPAPAAKAPAPAATSAPAADFSGKTITIVSTYGPGGSNDAVARAIAKFAPKHYPGNPRIVVTNIPGGASVVGTEYALSKVAVEEGLYPVMSNRWSILPEALGYKDFPNWDFADIAWIGSSAYPNSTGISPVRCAWLEEVGGWDNWLKNQDKTFKRGSFVTTGQDWMLAEMAGLNVKVVSGYSSQAESFAAMVRGEIDSTGGQIQVQADTFPDAYRDGIFCPHYRTQTADVTPEDLALLGLTEQPGTFLEVVPLPDDLAEVSDLMRDIGQAAHVYGISNATTPEIIQAHRDAFVAVHADPEFIKWREDRGYDVGFLTGEGYLEMLEAAKALPPEMGKLSAFYWIGEPSFLEGTRFEKYLD